MSSSFAPVWPGPCLVVPITVDALAVGTPDASLSVWAGTQFNYERLLNGGAGEPIPFSKGGAAAARAGIHLLFTLPFAMRSGAQVATAEGPVEFPLVPNRWLVTRFEYPAPGAANDPVKPPTLRAWVLASDGLEPLGYGSDLSQYPVPGNEPDDFEVKRIGKVVELASFAGPAGPATPFLRAVGPGALSWSATYDNVRNVFSLHDANPSNAATRTLPIFYTYAVLGWYAAPGDDLLAGLPSGEIADWMSAVDALQLTAGATRQEVDAAAAAWQAWQKERGLAGGAAGSGLAPQIATWIAKWKQWQTSHGDGGQKSPLPTQSLCYGWVTNVRWKGFSATHGSGAPGGGKPAQAVGIGNTASEAVAAWIAKLVYDQFGYHDPDALTDIEQALEAFQEGVLEELARDPAGAENLLHATRFGQSPGGHRWVVTRPQAAKGGPSSGHRGIPLSPEQTRLLVELNELQSRRDLLAAQLASLRQLLFTTYSKWLAFPRGTSAEVRNRACAALCVLQREIPPTRDQVAGLEAGVAAKAQALERALGAAYECRLTVLTAHTGPNDPVIFIGGLGRDSKLRAPAATLDDDQGRLRARFTGQQVSGIEVRFFHAGSDSPVRITANDVLGVVQLPAGNPTGYALPKEAADLWAEILLLDPSCAPLLAQLYWTKRNVSQPSANQRDQVTEIIRKIQTAPFAPLTRLGLDARTVAEAVGIVGTIPAATAIEFRGWPGEKQPWTPIYMDWQLRYFPSPGDFPRLLDDWRLGDIDYEWTGRTIPGTGVDFFGRTLLDLAAPEALTRKLETFVADDPNFANLPDFVRTALQQCATELRDADIVAQAAAGLTDQMLTRAEVMAFSLPNQNPSGTTCNCETGLTGTSPSSGSPISTDAILELLGPGFAATQQPIWSSTAGVVPFFPIRAGHLQIVNLQVVDAFGQILPGKNPSFGLNPIPNPFRSRSMVTRSSNLSPAQNATLASYAQLPPRLAQPARLRLRLLDANDDGIPATSADATSPICGWVVPNHLDDSLAVFDAAGNALGAIVNVERDDTVDNPSGEGIRWDPFPGSEQQLGASPRLPNAHLQALVTRLLTLGLTRGGVLRELLAAIDSTLWTVDPFAGLEGNLEVLLGHPLAVVRADLSLQLDGGPAYSEDAHLTGQYFVATQGSKPIYRRQPAPFQATRLRARIGDLGLVKNGVVGYFADDDYLHFYTAHGTRPNATRELIAAVRRQRPLGEALRAVAAGAEGEARNGSAGYVVAAHLLELQPQTPASPPSGAADETYSPTRLTVLMDPSGELPAIAGSLPKVEATLPPGPVAAALQRMKASFRIGPILGDPARIRMPLPAEVKGRWSWMARQDVVTWTGDRPIASDNSVNTLAPTPPVLSEGWLILEGGESSSDQD